MKFYEMLKNVIIFFEPNAWNDFFKFEVVFNGIMNAIASVFAK